MPSHRLFPFVSMPFGTDSSPQTLFEFHLPPCLANVKINTQPLLSVANEAITTLYRIYVPAAEKDLSASRQVNH